MTFDSGSSNMTNFKVSVSIEDTKSSVRPGTKRIFTHTCARTRGHTKKTPLNCKRNPKRLSQNRSLQSIEVSKDCLVFG